jgi:hypothetical protein
MGLQDKELLTSMHVFSSQGQGQGEGLNVKEMTLTVPRNTVITVCL